MTERIGMADDNFGSLTPGLSMEQEKNADRLQDLLEAVEGSKRRKGKKKLMIGANKLDAIRAEVLANSKRRALNELRDNPDAKPETNASIEVTLWRLMGLDEKEMGLAHLEQYLIWLRDIVEGKNQETDSSILSECDMDQYRKGKGAGGQNVQKTETSARILHEPTRMRLAVTQYRTLAQNRKDAIATMEKLVNEHKDLWLDIITANTTMPDRTFVWQKVYDIIGSKLDPDRQPKGQKLSDAKIESFEHLKVLFMTEEERKKSNQQENRDNHLV